MDKSLVVDENSSLDPQNLCSCQLGLVVYL